MTYDSRYPRFVQDARALNRQQLGRSGLVYYRPGYIRRDNLPELQGRNLWLQLDEMGTNDSTIGGGLSTYSTFIRRPGWKVNPIDDRNTDNSSADFLESVMNDMYHSWKTFIATAARPSLQFGFMPSEKVYKLREGPQDDYRYSSKYDDGYVGLSNLAPRFPDSILHWKYNDEDVTRLDGLVQLAAPDWHMQYIPIEKILNIRVEPGRDSPEGRSILRSAWRSWRAKKYNEDFRNVATEMGGTGIPWAEVPVNIANAPAGMAAVADLEHDDPAWVAANEALASYNSIVESLESIGLGQQKWMITPQIWNEQGQPQIKIGFLQPTQNGDLLGHITETIETEAKSILISMNTEFLALGMGGTGSLALSRDKTDNFTLSVGATLEAFKESINGQGVTQLFALNPQFEFEKDQPLPEIAYDPLVPLSVQDVVAMLTLFEKSGWDLSKQAGIRDALLKSLGLPEYVEQDVDEELGDLGDSPIEAVLEGRSALDAILGKGEAKRDYKREYREYHGSPKHIKERAQRNAARREMGLKPGDGKEVDHKNPISRGGTNSSRNLRAVSRDTNRGKGAS